MNDGHRAFARERAVIILLFLLWPLFSGAETSFVVRPLSLKDCIRIALEHNLDVKIERFTPEIASYHLNLASAYYDPVFGGSGIHRFGLEHAGADSTDRIGITTRSNE